MPGLWALLPILSAALPASDPELVVRQTPTPTASACAPVFSPGKYPTWQKLADQATMPDPFLSLSNTTTDSGNSAVDIMSGKAAGRIASHEEWYQCRQPEILNLLQEYQVSPWFPSLPSWPRREPAD
jgi:hypothetical protein